MESARGECGDKIFSPLLLLSFFLPCLVRQQTSLGFEDAKSVQQESTKGDTFYAALWGTTTKGEKMKEREKSAFILCTFYDKYHCFVRENVSSHTREHPSCHCHLNFFIIFAFVFLFRLFVTQKLCASFQPLENGQGWVSGKSCCWI